MNRSHAPHPPVRRFGRGRSSRSIAALAASASLLAAAGVSAQAPPPAPAADLAAVTGVLRDRPITLLAEAGWRDTYRVPPQSHVLGSPRVGNDGTVVFKLGVPDAHGFWVGGPSAGGNVAAANFAGAMLGLSEAGGVVAWTQYESPADGVYVWSAAEAEGADRGVKRLDLRGAFGRLWSTPVLNGQGDLVVVADFERGEKIIETRLNADPLVATTRLASAELDAQSPYAYLFGADYNAERELALKVRLGPVGAIDDARPDAILLCPPDAAPLVVAADRDGDPASPFRSFGNSLDLNDAGLVAFSATTDADGRSGVFLGSARGCRTVATEGLDGVGEVLSWSPAVNLHGAVVFRAEDAGGVQCVFLGGPDTAPEVLARVGDAVPTHRGADTIESLSGGPDVNAEGEIVFAVTLTRGGHAVYHVQAEAKPGLPAGVARAGDASRTVTAG